MASVVTEWAASFAAVIAADGILFAVTESGASWVVVTAPSLILPLVTASVAIFRPRGQLRQRLDEEQAPAVTQ
jgi:hypothetical protein